MKLKFTIHYRTAWGETLHVSIAYHSKDGTLRRQRLPLQTNDGALWTLETAAIMSRQHPLSHIVYHYELRNADDTLLRCEWNAVPRIYPFDASADYIFPDQWRDRPLPMHLYSAAFAISTARQRNAQIVPPQLSFYRRTIVFRVSAPQLQHGQSVALCGSHPAIGCWSTSRYLRMQPIGQHEWMLSVNALGWLMPIEYKYVVINDESHELVAWEEGNNREVITDITDGQVLVLHGGHLRICEDPWRVAGVSVPVFSLRSEHSFGVGDFGDLRRLIDWAAQTGMKVIQVLPVNDTSTDHRWHDSCPYNIVSMFALHPHYIDLEDAGRLRSKSMAMQFERRRRELNALPYSDYEAVDRVKSEYLQHLFAEQSPSVLESAQYKAFKTANEYWLRPYAAYIISHGDQAPTSSSHDDHVSDASLGDTASSTDAVAFIYYQQYLLHRQLQQAADYARSKGIFLKGDLPIGVNSDSVATRFLPQLFHLNSQAGAPPDEFSPRGQNWGFPTYNWQSEVNDSSVNAISSLLQQRFSHMAQYFDALRIDHVLGYFRIWEIPAHAIDAVLGHFSPSMPLTASEIEYFGLPFRKELFTKPFINDRLIDRLFGVHAQYVRDNCLVRQSYNLYDLRHEYSTQRQVASLFADRHDENSLWIRDGLMQLLTNVLFVEDQHQPDMYHPRIGSINGPVYEILTADEKDAFLRLYNNYFYQRHSFFWGQQAIQRLAPLVDGSGLLVCAEDLGMLPDCVEPVLDELRILSLQIQQLPKQQGFEFSHLEANPLRSVTTISTHDMPPLQLWWQEQPERRQRYYVIMLQKEGHAPDQLPAHLAEEIIARHLYCPSMLCILQLQDWLAMDSELRARNLQETRINTPSDPYNRWQYRMHLTIEQLMEASKYNNKVRTMIQRSRR